MERAALSARACGSVAPAFFGAQGGAVGFGDGAGDGKAPGHSYHRRRCRRSKR